MWFTLSTLVVSVNAHATITVPAMRQPRDELHWCADCQGDQIACEGENVKLCRPEMGGVSAPCYGAIPGSLAHPESFQYLKDPSGNFLPSGSYLAPDGTPWIEQHPSRTTWCPGQTYTIRFHIRADHNGVYRWEVSSGPPGSESEKTFHPISTWISFSADPNTTYYHEDGTEFDKKSCSDGRVWTPQVPECKMGAFAETTLRIPARGEIEAKGFRLPEGEAVVRWIWYGAAHEDGSHSDGPEPSLFANCGDIIIGGPTCGEPAFAPTPAPPHPTPTTEAPEPAEPTQGRCCYGASSCDAVVDCQAAGWCSEKEDQCTSNCNGMWCPQLEEFV